MPEPTDRPCISSVCPTVLQAFGLAVPQGLEPHNPALAALAADTLGGETVDRVLLYNPDAVALWIYEKYREKFIDAEAVSDLTVPMRSVMPSVTPVCFATMYSGLLPAVHGIQKYEKPVLTVDTLFDHLIRAGKKPVIVSTAGDSISKIFLERDMDYFIYDSVEEVNEKALALVREDRYDLITVYNGNYDGTMHKHGPEGSASLAALDDNLAFYASLVRTLGEVWRAHNFLYGFCPDHGCHRVLGGFGAHGTDKEKDMNVVHLYGVHKRQA